MNRIEENSHFLTIAIQKGIILIGVIETRVIIEVKRLFSKNGFLFVIQEIQILVRIYSLVFDFKSNLRRMIETSQDF